MRFADTALIERKYFMTIEKKVETRGHIVGFREEIAKAANSTEDEFFTWFNNAKDKNAAFIRGSWDFTVHIALPCSRFLSTPEDKVALEIGHGGGRILATASRYFRDVIGIDIHENNERVENELKTRGINNFRLVKTEGKDVPLDDNSVDCVYSFIVLQHVEKVEIFSNYLSEAHRILKPGGIAVLYFGRKCIFSLNRSSRVLYLVDKFAERILLPKGFREFSAKVNDTNLIVSLPYARSLARKMGYEILSELVSRKNVPDGITLYGGQNGLVMRKEQIQKPALTHAY
jgi:ubiquinone/menaquinone biosynthesis C-methylase UbiE